MELKDYQQQALDTLDRYLDALDDARQQTESVRENLPRRRVGASKRIVRGLSASCMESFKRSVCAAGCYE